jgi:hypothetical protein
LLLFATFGHFCCLCSVSLPIFWLNRTDGSTSAHQHTHNTPINIPTHQHIDTSTQSSTHHEEHKLSSLASRSTINLPSSLLKPLRIGCHDCVCMGGGGVV